MRSNTHNFYLSEKPNDNNTEINNLESYIINVNSDLNKFFDKENSSSLEITNKSIYSSPGNVHLGNISSDYIHFMTNLNNKIKIKIPFILYHTTMGNMPGVIGLKAVIQEKHKEYNFIDKLKLNDVINSYFWMINYTSDYEGNLIIGEQPHIFDPLHYNEKDLFFSYPFSDESIYDWGLKFNKIIFNEKNIKTIYPCLFNYEYNYIQGINELEIEMDKYFNESIKNNICFKEKIKYAYPPHKFYYCNKEKYKDNLKYFPSLKFYHNELNYTFELNYKDLFIEKHDKFILMIFFDEYTIEWYFGKPFLRKYSFLMNQDSKLLGFYHRKININETNDKNDLNNNNNNNYIIIIILLIIFGIIILFTIGIFIGKYYSKYNKKHVNIIDEDYDYSSKNDAIN